MTTKVKTDPDYFTGKWFHSADGSDKTKGLGWQGQIIKALPDGSGYMVQLYEWLGGGPTIVKRVALADLDGWRLYDTDAEMRNYAQRYWRQQGFGR